MTRLRRLLLSLVAVLLVAGGSWSAAPAWAAEDTVDSWSVSYAVQRDGTVRVVEDLAYRFGSNSGRHGIKRDLVTREAWDEKSDAVYSISQIRVTSPDADPEVNVQTADEGRDAGIVLRVGSASTTVRSAVAHYRISYVVSGATRLADGVPQFYWDVMSGETPTVRNISVKVSAPQGITQTECFVGIPERSSKGSCASATVAGGVATFTQPVKPSGQVFTVAAALTPGAVSPLGPNLTERGDAGELRNKRMGLAGGAFSLLLSPVLGLLYWRRRGRDLRFVGLPPGVLPAQGQKVGQRPSRRVEIPVAFQPPRVSPAEAQLLLDGEITTRLTTATLVDLAVRGAVQLSTGTDHTSVKLVDPTLATRPHEQVLISRLFGQGLSEVDATSRGSLYRAHTALVVSVRNQVAAQRWFTRIPTAGGRGATFSMFMMLAFGFFFFGGSSLSNIYLLLPVVPLVIVGMVVSRRMQRGQRTGLGRALTDQADGFRTYLATAEADQLRFEEGEDIFSRYLPWAIAFGLADRWANLCAELVREGRLSAEPPTWYYGPWDGWNFYVFNNSLSTMG